MTPPILAVGQPEIKDLIKDYEDVFTGIGKLKGVTVKLRVVPNADQEQRRISMPLEREV